MISFIYFVLLYTRTNNTGYSLWNHEKNVRPRQIALSTQLFKWKVSSMLVFQVFLPKYLTSVLHNGVE